MKLWIIAGIITVVVSTTSAETNRNKNRGRGSMWWYVNNKWSNL